MKDGNDSNILVEKSLEAYASHSLSSGSVRLLQEKIFRERNQSLKLVT